MTRYGSITWDGRVAWKTCTVILSRAFIMILELAGTHIDLSKVKNGLYVVYATLLYTKLSAHNGSLLANKPRGLQAARKLRNDRRENRWVCLNDYSARTLDI